MCVETAESKEEVVTRTCVHAVCKEELTGIPGDSVVQQDFKDHRDCKGQKRKNKEMLRGWGGEDPPEKRERNKKQFSQRGFNDQRHHKTE